MNNRFEEQDSPISYDSEVKTPQDTLQDIIEFLEIPNDDQVVQEFLNILNGGDSKSLSLKSITDQLYEILRKSSGEDFLIQLRILLSALKSEISNNKFRFKTPNSKYFVNKVMTRVRGTDLQPQVEIALKQGYSYQVISRVLDIYNSLNIEKYGGLSYCC